MKRKRIDLSDIKKNDLEETSTFTDLLTKKELENRKQRNIESNDIDDMINEKRKSTNNTSIKKEVSVEKRKKKKEDIEENLGKTQIMELTRQMRFNLEETKKENNEKKKNGISLLNIVGTINLFCIGFYIYLLTFTNYQDKQNNYLIAGSFIVLLVLLFGLSVVSNKKARTIFNIFNILTILSFIGFNIYILM